ncbi:C40 family peptidase [Paenibacillus silviterrae]|uniref:C40 family peptidase n=1 Tax=Paenibacillus silviterrae TaxID=3242194 RepID=UPI002543497C|nr:C40 family peptidase [Paenibacillus chinjuensis]
MLLRRLLVPFVLFLLILGMAAVFLPAKETNLGVDYLVATAAAEESLAVPEPIPGMLPPPEATVNVDCRRPSDHETGMKQIAVSVATLWAEPGVARPKDERSLQNPVLLRDWLEPLSTREKLWFVGKLETQALLGTNVFVLEEGNEWVKVAIPEQNTPKREEGYPGWMPKSQLAEVEFSYEACPKAVVSLPTAFLHEAPDPSSPSVEISFNTLLPVLGEEETWLVVDAPQGTRYVEKASVLMETDIEASREKLVETAQSFLGLPYIWSGASGFGFDCSGFTYSLYRSIGIAIPRDAKDQAKAGEPIPSSELLPGDLLFYAYDRGKGKVHHVAMYIGEGMMIHSPKTECPLEIIPMNTPAYAAEFAGARRFFP